MASVDTGPSNTQAARKPTEAEKKQRRAEKLAKHREKTEESHKVLGAYAELRKKIQGRAHRGSPHLAAALPQQ